MRQKLRIVKRLFLAIIAISCVYILYHTFFLAENEYQITNQAIISKNLPEEFDGFKIGFISDVNLNETSDLKRLEKIVKRINEENLDMVLFGGDLYEGEIFDSDDVIKQLKAIQSKYGKFAILGEKDMVFINEANTLLQESGFEVLHNEYRKLYYQGSTISLFGLEANGNLTGLINEENKNSFKLTVVHEPDYFDQTYKHTNLQISGHSQGGYINVPFLGSLFTRELAKNYVNGTYQKENATLLISNGLGNESDYSYRFLCPNEVLVITLKNQ